MATNSPGTVWSAATRLGTQERRGNDTSFDPPPPHRSCRAVFCGRPQVAPETEPVILSQLYPKIAFYPH
ncbi:hypothetical protein J6590_046206 [Homalodisca vitripennis]|nr:hypothetical protein J6590_046206 [Homalodisca vitripennis]